MRVAKGGHKITTVSEWFEHAPPKGGLSQWKDGRSAKECAVSWLAGSSVGAPAEVHALVSSHRDFGRVSYLSAEPEVKLPFDKLRGEVRNADLVVEAQDERGRFALTIEAKSDEAFGETVAEALSAAVERRLENERSRGSERIRDLCLSLFRPAANGEPKLGGLRYQLLTATSGTLAHASRIGASRAVLIIQEFVTSKTTDARHEANGEDLDRFICRLSQGAVVHCADGTLAGPFEIPGAPLFKSPAVFYVGKAVRNLR